MTSFIRTVGTVAFVSVMSSNTSLHAGETCLKHAKLTENIRIKAKLKGKGTPRFRIERDGSGQSIVYWDHGEAAKTFYGVTFRANGCAITLSNGLTRRYVFPKTRYNSGVFYEMEELKLSSLIQ